MLRGMAARSSPSRAIRQQIGNLDQQRNVVGRNGQTALGRGDRLFAITLRSPFAAISSQTGSAVRTFG